MAMAPNITTGRFGWLKAAYVCIIWWVSEPTGRCCKPRWLHWRMGTGVWIRVYGFIVFDQRGASKLKCHILVSRRVSIWSQPVHIKNTRCRCVRRRRALSFSERRPSNGTGPRFSSDKRRKLMPRRGCQRCHVGKPSSDGTWHGASLAGGLRITNYGGRLQIIYGLWFVGICMTGVSQQN